MSYPRPPIGTIQRAKGCLVDGCDKPHKAKGYCEKHYAYWRYSGTPTPARPYARHPSVARDATDVERAYAAGFFDGEGCLTIARRPKSTTWYARIDFGQTQPAGVKLLKSIYGGSLLFVPSKSAVRRGQFRYRLAQDHSVRKFLEDIAPYAQEKRDQVIAVLERFWSDGTDFMALQSELSAMKGAAYGADAAA